jgi:lipopolysaccharide/colanic/teichoic acid biosynthesis glycosyltransferase
MDKKRLLDIVGAAFALLMLSPAVVVVAIIVRSRIGRPVMFRQTRSGYFGKPFEILKFRTMTNVVDARGIPLPDADRLGRAGRFLRRASLDEIPEFWNVLQGHMSLVGPRPLLAEYLPLYSTEQRRRLEVKPGITGWAQIKGRNALTWERKFELDVWYVEQRSFRLDIKILALTAVNVFRQGGISQPGHVTAPVFMGSLQDSNQRPPA